MTTEPYEIVVSERGATGVKDRIAQIAQATDRTDASVNKLNKSVDETNTRLGSMQRTAAGIGSAFGTLGAIVGSAFSVSKVIAYSETFTKLQNQLRQTNTDTKSLGAATDQVYAISQRTGTSFEANAGTFSKLQMALRATGQDAAKAGPLLETIGQAVQASGVSAQSAEAGLYQFQQAMSQGVLRGEEFNSIMEQTPGIAQAIAVGMGRPVGALRELAEQGQLTTKVVFDALQKAAPSVAASAAAAIPTVSQALQRLENSFVNTFGKIAQGPMQLLIKGIDLLAANMDKVLPIALALGAAIGAWIAIQVVTWIGSIVIGLGAMAVGLLTATVRIGLMAAAWVAANIPMVAAGVVMAALAVAFLYLTGQGDKVTALAGQLKEQFEKLTATTKTTEGGQKTLAEQLKDMPQHFGKSSGAANDNKSALEGVGSAATSTSRAIGAMPFDQWIGQVNAHTAALRASAQAYAELGAKAAEAASQLAETANAFNNATMASSAYNASLGGATAADVASQTASGNGGGYRPKGYDPVVSGPGSPDLSGTGGGTTSGGGASVASQFASSAFGSLSGQSFSLGKPSSEGMPSGYMGTWLPVNAPNMQGISYVPAWIPSEYASMPVKKGDMPPGTILLDPKTHKPQGGAWNPGGGALVGDGIAWAMERGYKPTPTRSATPSGDNMTVPEVNKIGQGTKLSPGQPTTGGAAPSYNGPNTGGNLVGNTTINQYIQTPNAESFARSKRQIAQDTVRALRRA